MGEIKWVKVSVDLFSNDKVLLIENRPDRDTILTIWLKLICLAGKLNDDGAFRIYGQPYTEEMFAAVFARPEGDIAQAFDLFRRFGMIDEDEDGTVFIRNWEKYQSIDALDRARASAAKRSAEYRKRKRQQASHNNDVSITSPSRDCHGTEEDIDIDKDKREREKKEKSDRVTSRVTRFFENAALNQVFINYCRGRRSTEEAAEVLKERLTALAKKADGTLDEDLAITIVKNSIQGGWNSFYKPRAMKPEQGSRNAFHNMSERTDDLDAFAQEEMRRRLNGMDV